MEKLNWTPIIVSCIVVIGVLAAASLLASPDAAEARNINATGNAKRSFEPDQGVVIVKIMRSHDLAEIAKNETAKIINQVLDALTELGIDERDIESTSYNVKQNYMWVNDTKIWTDYTATSIIKVTVKDFDKIGQVIDASVEAGALINSIDFELSQAKLNEYKALVMADAAKDARDKAESVISSLGNSLGEVVSVTFGYVYNPYRYWNYGKVAIDGSPMYTPPTEIQPRDLDVSATLSVVFEIL